MIPNFYKHIEGMGRIRKSNLRCSTWTRFAWNTLKLKHLNQSNQIHKDSTFSYRFSNTKSFALKSMNNSLKLFYINLRSNLPGRKTSLTISAFLLSMLSSASKNLSGWNFSGSVHKFSSIKTAYVFANTGVP